MNTKLTMECLQNTISSQSLSFAQQANKVSHCKQLDLTQKHNSRIVKLKMKAKQDAIIPIVINCRKWPDCIRVTQ